VFSEPSAVRAEVDEEEEDNVLLTTKADIVKEFAFQLKLPVYVRMAHAPRDKAQDTPSLKRKGLEAEQVFCAAALSCFE